MLKTLTRENVVADLRYLLKERYGSYAEAGRQLNMDLRDMRRLLSLARAKANKRVVNRLNGQITLLTRMGYEVRFTIEQKISVGARDAGQLRARPLSLYKPVAQPTQ